jgi:NADH dehydrogenase/NADH:ubiquinone oxidoreductase subunit G
LGADEKEDYAGSFDSAMHEASEGSPFVVYQGHHGDLGAKQSNLVMPTTSYVEKKGTYVNTEGFVQQTDSIGNMQVESSAQNEAHDD